MREQGLGAAGEDLGRVRLFTGRGCRQCGGSGYRGRIGLFEILCIDDDIRELIVNRRDAALIRATAVRKGMKPMFQDGLAKLLLGETTTEELIRVTA